MAVVQSELTRRPGALWLGRVEPATAPACTHLGLAPTDPVVSEAARALARRPCKPGRVPVVVQKRATAAPNLRRGPVVVRRRVKPEGEPRVVVVSPAAVPSGEGG